MGSKRIAATPQDNCKVVSTKRGRRILPGKTSRLFYVSWRQSPPSPSPPRLSEGDDPNRDHAQAKHDAEDDPPRRSGSAGRLLPRCIARNADSAASLRTSPGRSTDREPSNRLRRRRSSRPIRRGRSLRPSRRRLRVGGAWGFPLRSRVLSPLSRPTFGRCPERGRG